jgi:glycosyltransferase involved in cell wall biosynthesis
MRRRKRLLIVTPFAPRLDAIHGGGRAVAQLIVALARDHDVRLLSIRASDEPAVDPTLIAACVSAEEFVHNVAVTVLGRLRRQARSLVRAVAGVPSWASRCFHPDLTRRLQSQIADWQPDVVQFEFHVMGQYAEGCPDGTFARVLTQHEPGIAAARERLLAARGTARATALIEYASWRRYEARVLRDMDAIVAFTERDAAAVRQAAPGVHVECIPLGVSVPDRALDARGLVPGQILYVGNYRHPPNVDAALRLARDILPRVREHVPGAHVVLAGAAPPSELASLAGSFVTVTGEIPSVEPYLHAAAAVAVPLRHGGGMRVKVLDALAAGKAVVATRLALEGLRVADGDQVLIADDDAEFAAALVSLLGDPELRVRIGAAARRWAEGALGWESIAARYNALYDALPARRQ